MNNYEWLVGRLDAFIRKYYANKVIKGTLIFLSCILLYILTVSIGEYFLYLPVWSRLIIMSVFVVLGLASLLMLVITPLAQMAKLGAVISHERAASIIGQHFPEISDRLLNILQLKRHPDNNASRELAEASINQKISQLSVIPITAAVDFSKNKKYLPFLLPILLVGLFILVAAPNVFREGSSRLLQPTRTFEKPSPFRFIIKNQSLQAIRNSDFTITLETRGSALPAEAYVEIGNDRIPMQAMEGHTFQYTFRNVTDAISFRFYGGGYYSQANMLKVVQRPVLKSFRVQLSYPPYIGKKNELRNSLSDMTIPAGTDVTWTFEADHTDEAKINFGNGPATGLRHSGSDYRYAFRFLSDTTYTISLLNKQGGIADSYRYNVQVIPDQYPVIQLQQFKDTVSGKQVLITGTAGDDYSITRVLFNYEITDKTRSVAKKSMPVRMSPGVVSPFQYYFDIQSLNLQPGQKLSYYIEAWDNDGVHGSKASRSEVMAYFMYDEKQIDSAINENSKQINSGISSSAERTKALQSEYKDMQSKMLQSDHMDWEQQQSLQEMMKKQMDLKTNIENIKQRFEEQMQQSEQKKYSDNLKEKQKELDKQLDNLLNEDLKEQLKKLQELMQKLNKDQAVDAMKQIEQENKLFKMDMERMEAMMKKMEQQMRMEDMANKMDDLAKKERELQQKTEQADKNNKDLAEGNKKETKDDGKNKTDQGLSKKDDRSGKDKGKDTKTDDKALAKEQKDLKDQLDKAMKDDMKEAQKLAKETKQQDKLQKEEEQGKDAQGDMKESEDALEQKQKSKASKSQSKAAENLEHMAKSLREKAGGMDMETLDLDIRATRQLLTNIIRLSFDQEDLMDEVAQTATSSQSYVTNQDEQNRLLGNSRMIRDSLFSLSKQLSADTKTKLPVDINKKTVQLEQHMKRSVEALENRNVALARTSEQYVMTSANDLALILNELLANLMQMQSEGKKGGEGGSCSKPGMKPGKGKPGGKGSEGAGQQLADIITEQQKLGNAMQQMGGKKPGEKDGNGSPKPGQGKKQGEGKGKGQGQNGGQNGGQGGNGEDENEGENGDAEQLARLAEQQASIRRKIQELTSLLNSKGLGNSRELRDIAEKMDKNESDLVNRRTSGDLMLRQKDIQTRLLEAEKSLREQEQDDKRASNTGKELSKPVPAALQKYITDQRQLLELYKTVPPQLKPYYRNMVENYFQLINPKVQVP